MSRPRIVVVAAALAAIPLQAFAADMPPLPPVYQAEPLAVREFASGWYLRGDIGYRINNIERSSVLKGPAPSNGEIDPGYAMGGGIGYKAGWFRADMTADFGTRAIYRADAGATANDYYVKLDNIAIMVNGYLDLGTWAGFTPYIGGGVGGVYIGTYEFERVSLPPPVPTPVSAKWNFGWAAMAGIAYNVTPNWVVDLGYRYLSMGTTQTEWDWFYNKFTVKDLTAHEFKLGVRYQLD